VDEKAVLILEALLGVLEWNMNMGITFGFGRGTSLQFLQNKFVQHDVYTYTPSLK
jgi:hypothetical protein